MKSTFSSTSNPLSLTTPAVAAAASVPSSFTSIKDLCRSKNWDSELTLSTKAGNPSLASGRKKYMEKRRLSSPCLYGRPNTLKPSKAFTYCFVLLVMKGTRIDVPLRRWNSLSLVTDASNFSSQAPLKYNAFANTSLVELSTESAGNPPLRRWNSWSFVSEASNFSFQAPLKYSAFAKIS
ncbi:hypothetical protein H5410_024447 [Solanum commersonii]|uniref:Uncharacterized protein n=1 Tax=Solanum commersonii TaxID=4109 RepID=A0A9J5ZM21_SOLCO|nr:hypothetical protein H5410_024447 [Solanum commersonii]